MIVLEVAFVLVNLAVPYWIWTSKTTNIQPQVEHESLKRTLFELSEASGGFAPCETTDLVEVLDDLCEKSRVKWSTQQSTAFERAGLDVVFSCEVKRDEIRLQWFPEKSNDHDLNCEAGREEMMSFGPTFVMNLKGQMRRIEYTTPNGGRAAAPLASCRRKLKTAKSMVRAPASIQDFAKALGHLPNDPQDYLTENLICLGFDPHPEWDAWRKKYGK